MEEKQYCTFYLDDMFFGIEVTKVQEIIKYNEMTRVPLAPGVICGLINLRGQIVTAINLRRRFELSQIKDAHNFMNVILNTGDGAVSFLVDRIGDVIEIGSNYYESAPETLKGVARELISGAYKLENGLLLVLDIQKVLEIKV